MFGLLKKLTQSISKKSSSHKIPLVIPKDLEDYEKDIIEDLMIANDEAPSFPNLNPFLEKWGLAAVPIMIRILKNDFGNNCLNYYTMCFIVLSNLFPKVAPPFFGNSSLAGYWVAWYDTGCFTISNKYDR